MMEIERPETNESVPLTAMDRIASYTLSYLLAAFLLGALIYVSGFWNFLANTRLLDTLINSGVIQLHDAQTGIIKGVPDLSYYLKSQDLIKWDLVQLAAGLFVAFWLIKALQFHFMARFTGIQGTFTQHARAYLHGIGLNRLIPFNGGNIAMARAVEAQGARMSQAAQTIFLSEIFVVIEIIAFALWGLYALGWYIWIKQLFWPFIILAITYWIVRPGRNQSYLAATPGSFKDAWQSLRVIAQAPLTFSKVTLLSLLAFGLEDIAAYVIAMAFTSTHVNLSVNFTVLLLAVVGGYIARLIPVTPGGIGQFEWGFAAALYFGGLGLPECVAIAILDNVIRYVTGTMMLIWVYILRVDYAFEVFTRGQQKAPGGV